MDHARPVIHLAAIGSCGQHSRHMMVDPSRPGGGAGGVLRVKIARGLFVLAVILLFVAQFLWADPSPEEPYRGWDVFVGAIEGLGTGFLYIRSSTGRTYSPYADPGWELMATGIVFLLVYTAILTAPFLVGFLRRATPLRWLSAFLFTGLAGFMSLGLMAFGMMLDYYPPFLIAMSGSLVLTATALIVLPGHQKRFEVKPLSLAENPADERG